MFANRSFDARLLAEKFLPINQSLVRFDLLAIVFKEAKTNNLTVKRLFATLPHSDTGLRYHFRKLLHDGWIEIWVDPNDRRHKLVKPTQKLIEQFELFMNEVLNAVV